LEYFQEKSLGKKQEKLTPFSKEEGGHYGKKKVKRGMEGEGRKRVFRLKWEEEDRRAGCSMGFQKSDTFDRENGEPLARKKILWGPGGQEGGKEGEARYKETWEKRIFQSYLLDRKRSLKEKG